MGKEQVKVIGYLSFKYKCVAVATVFYALIQILINLSTLRVITEVCKVVNSRKADRYLLVFNDKKESSY